MTFDSTSPFNNNGPTTSSDALVGQASPYTTTRSYPVGGGATGGGGSNSSSPNLTNATNVPPNNNGGTYMQQFQIQLTTGPQALNNGGVGRGSAAGGGNNTPGGTGSAAGGGSGGAYTYGGPSGVRASVACDACRKRKVKCTVVHPQQPGMPLNVGLGYGGPDSGPPPRVCVRCSRLSIECSWKDEKKGKSKMGASRTTPPGSAPTSVSVSGAQGLEVVFEKYPIGNGYVATPPYRLVFRFSDENPALLLRFSFLNHRTVYFLAFIARCFYLAHRPQGLP